jgi:hypothetical protein
MDRHSQSPSPLFDLSSLIAWYKDQCDGTWEHRFGIKLETLDNPGWILKIDLVHTDLQGRVMGELNEGLNPRTKHPVSPHWIHCFVRENQFIGACDPDQVGRLFVVFQEFRISAGK